jgi:hypothetical protein
MTVKLIEHGSMFLHRYIFLSYFFNVLYNKKNVSSLISLCIHVACVNKQTEGEKEQEKKRTRQKKNVSESNNRENVYKNEQNGTNTRIQPMRQNKEIDRQRKKNERKTKMSDELRFK